MPFVADSFLSVRVNLHERTYDIRIGSGTLALLGKFLNEPRQLKRAFIITDDHVAAHAGSVAASLKAAGTQVDTILRPLWRENQIRYPSRSTLEQAA